MKNEIEVKKCLTEIPASVMTEPTREQLTLQIICIEKFDGGDADYFYDTDGYTLYAKASNGTWKITNEEMKILHLSKN